MKKIFQSYLLFAIVFSSSFFVAPAPAEANGLQSVVQDGYQWRNDNGDERTATAMEPENTPAYIPLGGKGRLRMSLSDPGVSSIELPSGSNNLTSAVVDVNGGYAYFGTDTAPAQVHTVRLSDFSHYATLTMASGQGADNFRTGVINPVGRWAAFGTYNASGTIQVINLDTMMPWVVITIPGASYFSSSAIDMENQLMFFGTDTVPGMIVTIDFSAGFFSGPAIPAAITNLTSAAIDTGRNLLMFGSNTDPAGIQVFNYSTGLPIPVQLITLANGSSASYLTAGTHYRDQFGNDYGRFASNTDPGKYVRVSFADFSVAVTEEAAGNGWADFRTATSYGTMLIAAFDGNGVSMGNLSLFGTGDDTPQARVTNAMGYQYDYYWPAGTGGFHSSVTAPMWNHHLLGSNTNPGRVHRIYMNPTFNTTLEYAEVPAADSPCDGQLMWRQVPGDASEGGEAWEMASSRNFEDGSRTLDLTSLSNTGEIFSPGQIRWASSDISGVYMTENGMTELEYSLQPTENAENGQHYCFRVRQGGLENGFGIQYQVYGRAVIGTKSGGATCPNDGVEISVPSGGEVWPAGGEGQIFWSTRGCSLQGVTLSLSLDGGETYPTVLAENIPHANGFLFWDVPADHPYTDQARIKIDLLGTAGAIRATDESALFTIDGVVPSVDDPIIDDGVGAGGGPSCAPVGGLLMGSEGDTVYSCGSDGLLHPFPNVGTYLSWYGDDYSMVETLPQSSIDALTVGSNVTYKPGVRMLKTVSDAKTYYVAGDGLLRWVVNEEVAAELYGPDWNQYIDDIPQELFDQDYLVGEPLTSGEGIGPLVYVPSTKPSVNYGSLALEGSKLTLARDDNSTASANSAVASIDVDQRPDLAELFYRLRSK